MLSSRWLKGQVRTAENYQILYAEEHPAKGHNKESFHFCALTCTGKICLCQP